MVVALLVFLISSTRVRILSVVIAACAFRGVASSWLSQDVLGRDDGTPEMRGVGDPIREGAAGFLKVQYTVSRAIFVVSLSSDVIFVFVRRDALSRLLLTRVRYDTVRHHNTSRPFPAFPFL